MVQFLFSSLINKTYWLGGGACGGPEGSELALVPRGGVVKNKFKRVGGWGLPARSSLPSFL